MPAFTEPPNRKAILDAVFATGRFELVTKAGCGIFTEAVGVELAKADPGQWFHLKKHGGQNQWNGHAVDGLLHGPTGYFVDIISNSESPNAKPSWSLDRVTETGGGPRYFGRTDLQIPIVTEPPPTDGNGPALETRLKALEELVVRQGATIMSLEQRAVAVAVAVGGTTDRVAALEALRESIDNRLTALERRPDFELPDLVAVGTTGRVFGHGHPVRLPVVRGRA